MRFEWTRYGDLDQHRGYIADIPESGETTRYLVVQRCSIEPTRWQWLVAHTRVQPDTNRLLVRRSHVVSFERAKEEAELAYAVLVGFEQTLNTRFGGVMEKNGNTLAPGTRVVAKVRDRNKVAQESEKGDVKDVDVDKGLVHVKWAHSTEWVDFDSIEKID